MAEADVQPQFLHKRQLEGIKTIYLQDWHLFHGIQCLEFFRELWRQGPDEHGTLVQVG